MKRVYTKPMLFAESFELTEHIAGGCATDELGIPNLRDLTTCGLKINGQDAVAFQTEGICHDWYNEDLGEWVGLYCYNTFNDEYAMFAS